MHQTLLKKQMLKNSIFKLVMFLQRNISVDLVTSITHALKQSAHSIKRHVHVAQVIVHVSLINFL